MSNCCRRSYTVIAPASGTPHDCWPGIRACSRPLMNAWRNVWGLNRLLSPSPAPKLPSAKRTKSRCGSSTASGFEMALKGALVWCAGPSNWRAVLIMDWRALNGGSGGESLLPTWSLWRDAATDGVAVRSGDKSAFSDKNYLSDHAGLLSFCYDGTARNHEYFNCAVFTYGLLNWQFYGFPTC